MGKKNSSIEIIEEVGTNSIDSQISKIIESSHKKIGDIVFIEDLSSLETNLFRIFQRSFLDKLHGILGISGTKDTDQYSRITDTVNEFRKTIINGKTDDYDISKSA